MKELQRLQQWYASQCDQDWEHSFGVKIDTLDNPGWIVQIDLTDTDLASHPFVAFSRGDSEAEADWIHCKAECDQFIGTGGAGNLVEIVETFLTWAAR